MNQLGVFAKYWQPGRVKTRLAADIGNVAASEIYREFVVTLLARLQAQADRCVICYSPPTKAAAFRPIADGWQLQPQCDGDLGTRMRSYFDDALTAGCEDVVLLGSDSPNIPVEFIAQAFTTLKQHDVVLGPVPDGGYYLIGARGRVPNIFDDIDWSTPQVWAQTVANVDRERLTHALLPTWYDVDEIEDLQRLRRELEDTDETSLVALRETIDRFVAQNDSDFEIRI